MWGRDWKRWWAGAGLLWLLGAAFLCSARAATVVYVAPASGDGTTLRQLQVAAQFYGLDLLTVPADGKALAANLQSPETVAAVVDAGALPALNQSRFLASISHEHRVPVLIAGIDSGTDVNTLKNWSAGAVTGVGRYDAGSRDGSYAIASVAGITNQLSGVSLAAPSHAGPYLQTTAGAQLLMEEQAGGMRYPLFVRTGEITAGEMGAEVFLAVKGTPLRVPEIVDPYRQMPVFAQLAPVMMFLRHAAGDRAWHAPGRYANLTIDDVWLRDPYGNVDYRGLLGAMKKHRFHTTMAFIPWNYDRSQPAMVELFKAHPEQFSICIHGNNHVHQEFGPLARHPLSRQIEDMRQAVARMERFHSLTGLPYDRVMVFPHSIAPLATFAELKRANYLATANSLNTPSDASPTADPNVALRTTTLDYANFPSMRRYSAETDIPTAQMAVDAFLGNPILLYVHEGFFAGGMDRFDKTADTVNRLDPTIEWRGLGDIARHSYLERTRDGGSMDVKLETAVAEIHNKANHPVAYTIEKPENFALPIRAFVDGKSVPFERKPGQLQIHLSIDAGQSSDVSIQYGEPLNVAAIDIGKQSLSVAIIRHLSDFRDDVVSKSAIGRRFIRSYADEGAARWNWGAAIVLAAILLITLVIRRARGNKTRAPLSSVSVPGR